MVPLKVVTYALHNEEKEKRIIVEREAVAELRKAVERNENMWNRGQDDRRPTGEHQLVPAFHTDDDGECDKSDKRKQFNLPGEVKSLWKVIGKTVYELGHTSCEHHAHRDPKGQEGDTQP